MPLILGTNSIKDTGFDVDNSLRFNSGDSAKMSKTIGTPTSNRKFTVSCWVKLAKLGTQRSLWGIGSSDASGISVRLQDDDTLDFFEWNGSGNTFGYSTNQKFRDVGAWYNFCFAVDTEQGTAHNRVRIYLNGTEIDKTNLTDNPGDPTQNVNLTIASGDTFNVADDYSSSNEWDGYIAEFVYIDGLQLDPTSFGEFDEDSGIWKPIDVSGLTFGTNGFYLDFEDSSALGNDVSGNNNDFTVNNLTAIDQSISTPTNIFATFNPLAVWRGQNTTPSSVLEEGNLKVAIGSSEVTLVASTFGVTSGKWYWESKSNGVGRLFSGFVNKNAFGNTSEPHASTNSAGISYYEAVPDFRGNSGDGGITTGVVSISSGDVLGFALDMDNFAFYISKNGTYMNSGNPTSGSNKTGAISELFTNGSQYLSDHGEVFPCCYVQSTDFVGTASYNFGSPPYSESGGNSDGNGYGNFAASVPSGYFCLNSKNLAEYG